ncbi:MAG: hypothetical protein AAFS10_24875, partial [Myxococcota bacterium]
MRSIRTFFLLLALLAAPVQWGCGEDDSGGGADTASDGGIRGGDTSDAGNSTTTPDGGGIGGDFVFEGEQVACEANTQYEAQRSVLAGGKNNPTGRGEQAGIFDPCNNRVIVFGGNDRQPEECDSFG